MATEKKYWKSFEELVDSPIAQRARENEFAEELPVDEFLGNKGLLENSSTTRRDFLKYLGFSTAAATLAACESPIVESIPYVVKPDSLTPGMPSFYATTFFDGDDFASVLVKTREGRPIKIEPNSEAFNGSTNARVQASVLSLYDSARLREPMKGDSPVEWNAAISEIRSAIEKAAAAGKKFALLTSTVISPSTERIINDFASKFSNFVWVQYDSYSVSHKLDLYQGLLGSRVMPYVNLQNADLIVSFDADFLGDYNGQDMSADYVARRQPGKGMSRHIQLESNLSLTGSNADKRIKIKPSERLAALAYLHTKIDTANRYPIAGTAPLRDDLKASLDMIAAELSKSAERSVVLVGGNNFDEEGMALAINGALSNFGSTLMLSESVRLRRGDDKELVALINSMKAGEVGVLMGWNINPFYDLSDHFGFAEAFEKVGTTAMICDRLDETSSNSTFALPVHHALESWGDFLPRRRAYAIAQPTISPLFNSLQAQDIFLKLQGSEMNYLDSLKAFYANNAQAITRKSWSEMLHDGAVVLPSDELAEILAETKVVTHPEVIQYLSTSIGNSVRALNNPDKKASDFELVFYRQSGIGMGKQVNNPWLHEMPDPITRVAWDNYLTISAADALKLDLENYSEPNGAVNGYYVNLTANGKTLENVPVWVQPGQMQGTVGLAVGFGRTAAGKVANGLGVNAYSLMTGDDWTGVTITKVEGEHHFAATQLGHTMMGRKIVNEVSLADFVKDPSGKSWNDKPVFETYAGPMSADKANLWDDLDHETSNMWNMSIDLNNCIGCGACVVACHLENNVPVVGKDEMRRHRDMHWLRIDRYYSSDMTEEVAEEKGIGAMEKFSEMEHPSASPEVVFQPVMCQHCNHAPCETVCPVAATSHSREGLNHMAYNRCIGTRYCANNCPYKVRRFNWFNYQGNEDFATVNPAQDDYGRMVLNPDVVVRARGVMEKCSMCIQRIQYGKLEAKKAGRPIIDGEFTTACAQACSTGAFVFGDVNNSESKVAQLKKDARAYHLLEEVGTQPSVFYQTKVRNRA